MVPEFAQIDNGSITTSPPAIAREAAARRGCKENLMDQHEPASRIGRHRSLRISTAGLLAFILLSGTAVAACTGASGAGATGPMATMTAEIPATAPSAAPADGTVTGSGSAPMDMVRADASDAWAHRPAFVTGDRATEEAYAYALYHPQVIQWMPCYCGCVGMGHRSNLDCYLKPDLMGGKTVFEEHASYCDVCVKTTLLAKQMYSQGKSLREIRQAVDRTFGGAAPGTNTDQPPA
jgi:hypothetical protein